MELTAYINLVIAVMVLTFIGTISGEDASIIVPYKAIDNGYTFQLKNRSVKFFDTIKTLSILECALYCKSEECHTFKYKTSDHSCHTFHIWKDQVFLDKSHGKDEQSFTTYEHGEWVKLYYFTAGSGVAVYNSFMGIGARSTWHLPKQCAKHDCPEFFRSHLLDGWKSLPIEKVKLVIYKNGSTAATMIFNGKNTTIYNWFTPERVLSSPWNDLKKENITYFSVRGVAGVRRFYIHKGHLGCKKDYGWLSVGERKYHCDWENKFNSYPTILFSKYKSATKWATGHGVGDSMAIFIKLG